MPLHFHQEPCQSLHRDKQDLANVTGMGASSLLQWNYSWKAINSTVALAPSLVDIIWCIRFVFLKADGFCHDLVVCFPMECIYDMTSSTKYLHNISHLYEKYQKYSIDHQHLINLIPVV